MTQTAPPAADRAHRAAKRYIYAWGGGRAEGDATMRDLLGGKGAGLAEMTNAGLPVPPGFTITTEACNDYFTAGEKLPDGLWEDVLEAVREVETLTGKGFGDAADPLLVSVRSGAKFSMPGMMDTVLNLGPQRGDAPRADRADRQRALRLGRLPALHPDVRADRDGREGRALRPRARGGQARPRRRAGHRPDAPTTCARSPTSSRRSSARTPAATSRPTRTSSSTWPSRRSSPPGSASAPSTTATTRRSPTTSARRSTS